LYLKVRWLPQTTTNETYLLNTQLAISFLARIGFSTVSDSEQVEIRIRKMSEKWLTYETRFQNSGTHLYEPPKDLHLEIEGLR